MGDKYLYHETSHNVKSNSKTRTYEQKDSIQRFGRYYLVTHCCGTIIPTSIECKKEVRYSIKNYSLDDNIWVDAIGFRSCDEFLYSIKECPNCKHHGTLATAFDPSIKEFVSNFCTIIEGIIMMSSIRENYNDSKVPIIGIKINKKFIDDFTRFLPISWNSYNANTIVDYDRYDISSYERYILMDHKNPLDELIILETEYSQLSDAIDDLNEYSTHFKDLFNQK